MRHPESQRFHQWGGGGPVDPRQAPYGSTEAAEPDPAWAKKAEWERLKAEGRAPLPTSAHPDSMTEQQMVDASAAGSFQAMKPYMHRRMYKNAQESGTPMPDDIESGHKLMVRPGGARGGAAGGPGSRLGPFTGQRMMSTGGTPAKYSKADIRRENALASRMRGQAAVFAQQRDAFTKDMVQQQYGWIEAARKEQAEAGAEAGAARDQYLAASKSIQRNRARLEKMEIDPDRYWNSLTETQQTMTRVKQMFGALAVGFSQGRIKNSATEALKRAQERDMVAQNTNMKKLLQTIDLDDRDRTALWSRWQAGEAKRRQTGFAVMQLQLSRAGLMEKRLGIKEQYAGVVNQLDAHMNEVLRGSRGRGGRRVMTPEYAQYRDLQKMAFGSELKKDQIREAAQFRKGGKSGDRGDVGAKNAISQIGSMVKAYKGSAWATLFGQALTDDAADYQQKKGLLGLSLWRMFDSGKLSDADMQMAFTMFFPNAKRAIWEHTKGIDVRQMLRLKGWLQERMREEGTYKPKSLSGVRKKYANIFGVEESQLPITPQQQDATGNPRIDTLGGQ